MFNSEQVANFLWNKRVVVIGDSIQRSIYKDLIRLLVPDATNAFLTDQHLKTKGELEFLGDKLLQGGQLGEMRNGINYREVRQYNSGSTVIRFYFVTRCYSDYTKSILHGIKCMRPHAIIMNSCLWDLHRYGLSGPLHYIDNMHKLMFELKKVIHSSTVFIWNATLPLDSKCRGGFLLPYVDNIPAQEIIGANFAAANIVQSHGFVFLDLYSVLMHRIDLRENDGIHWNALANRIITSHILIRLSYAWKLPIPKPKIQDPRVHHPHLEFSSKIESGLAHFTGNLPQMRSDFRHHFGPIPAIRDPPYGHQPSEFSNDPLPSYYRSLLYNSDVHVNRLGLKNIENTSHFVYENLLRDSFAGRNIYPADNLALIRHAHTPPASPLDKLFIHPSPSPQMYHTTPADIDHTPPASSLNKPSIHPSPSPQMSHTNIAHTHHTPPASSLNKPSIHPSPSPQMSHTNIAHTHHTPPASSLNKPSIHPSPSPQMSHTNIAHTHRTPPASSLNKPSIHPSPSPQMSHITSIHDRPLLGLPTRSPSIPKAPQRQDHLYHTSAHNLLPPRHNEQALGCNQHSSGLQVSRPSHFQPKVEMARAIYYTCYCSHQHP